jgi:hypothetical protein
LVSSSHKSDLLFVLVHPSAMQYDTLVMELIWICLLLLSIHVEMFSLFLYARDSPSYQLCVFSDKELSFVKFVLSSFSE